MRITLEISDETFVQYERAVKTQNEKNLAGRMLAYHAKQAILKELQSEVSCGIQVIKVLQP